MISDQIRQAVIDCPLSLNAVAKRVGIPQPVLYRFVHGEKQPDGSYVYRKLSEDNLDILAKLFGMKLTRPKQLR